MRQGIVAAGLFAFIFSFDNLPMALFLAARDDDLAGRDPEYLNTISTRWWPRWRWRRWSVGAVLLALDRFVRLGQVVVR